MSLADDIVRYVNLPKPTLAQIADAQRRPTCPECERTFDLMDETDAAEFYYGHDCE
jgi:hypothetical protein